MQESVSFEQKRKGTKPPVPQLLFAQPFAAEDLAWRRHFLSIGCFHIAPEVEPGTS